MNERMADGSARPPGSGPEGGEAPVGGARVGRLVLALLAPGARPIALGRWGTGLFALLVWVLSIGILVGRWERVVAAPRGDLEDLVALASLLIALLATAAWSLRDALRRDPLEPEARGVSQWDLTVRSFRRNRLAVAGLVLIGLLYFVALVTPFLAPHEPDAQDLTMRLSGLSLEHPLGLDRVGRDVLSRVLYGARISLSIGLLAVAISVTIGTLLGAIAGYVGGRVDTTIMRFVDIVISFPRLVLLIAIIGAFGPSFLLIIVVLGLTQWPGTSRIVRAEVLSLREREFVEAARALGMRGRRILLRHLVPNALAPVIVAATLGIGNTIILEAGLSFLGLGIESTTPSWGGMVAYGRGELPGYWWISTFAGLAIVFTVVAFNVVGDGLRDALDPRLRRGGA